MTNLFNKGDSFYYANRAMKQAEKCTVIETIFQHPMAYIAKKEDSGEIFKCYHDFGCFKAEQEAYKDAQVGLARMIK